MNLNLNLKLQIFFEYPQLYFPTCGTHTTIVTGTVEHWVASASTQYTWNTLFIRAIL